MGFRAVPLGSVRLDAMLARRPRLTPGECVTLAAGVAADLALLHEQGRVHGDVRAARVVVAPDGSVGLDDSTETSASSPTEDVAELGRLVEGLLDSGAPALLVRLLAAAHSADPEGRPDAAELAELVVRACPPTPIRLARDPAPRRTERPTVRRVAVTVVLGGALVGAIGLGRAWGGQESAGGTSLPAVPSPSVSPSIGSSPTSQLSRASTAPLGASSVTESPVVATPSVASTVLPNSSATSIVKPRSSAQPVDWERLVASLDRKRGRALATGDAADLVAVDVAGSPSMDRDLVALDLLARRGVVARGWRLTVEVVVVERRTPHRAILRVRDRLSAYRLVGRDDVVRHSVVARGLRWWRLELRQSGGGWRFWDAGPLPT